MDKWKMAPVWAHWFTVGNNGAAYWWEAPPHLIAGTWRSNWGMTSRADPTLEGGQLRIERRPNLLLFDNNMEA